MNVSSDDFILTCVKNIVYKYLVIDINDSSFENFLSEDKNKDIVLNVLSEPNESQKCLFFYKTIIEEEIEPEDELPNIEEKPMSKVALDILKSLDIIDINAENRQDTNASETTLLATSNIEPEDEKDQSDHSLHSVSTSGEEHEPKEGNIEEIPEVLINDDTEDSDENENPDEDKENGKKESRERLTKSRTSLVMIVKKIKLQICLNVAEYEPSQQYVYFLKRVDDILPPVHSAEEAHRMIMHYFEVGYLSQHPLVCIDKVISLLYMPMLEEENLKAHVPSKLYKIKDDQISSLFAGFQKHMKDLRNITRQMISQTETPFIFTLPEIPEDSSLEQLAQETVFTTEADCLMREWNDRILDLLEQITQEKPEEKNLLEEVKFWDNQKWKVGVCHDQLNHTAIKETIQVLKLANCSVAEFETNVTMVENQLHKITEIINYLILLVPYTKNILSEDYTLEEWKKNLEQVFVVLKVMWMQSDYFKKVDNMSRIFKSISILLKQKVKELARIDVLFKKPLQKVKQIVTDSVEVLSFWKKLYMEESENVKKFGSAYWWTFDIRHFFNDTDYIIIICKDMENIANKLHELHNIFNTHLRLFVENVKELNALRSRIFSMTLIIQYAQFDPFEVKCKSEWKKVTRGFHSDLKSLETEVKAFLRNMFQNSLSWENGYILAKSFNNVSPTIKEFIVESRVDMLRQFIKEISETENMFLAQERNPPRFGDIPETASAVLWIQDLLSKITHPMDKIMDSKDLSHNEMEIHERFKKTELLLRSYQQRKYESWKISAAEKLNKFLHSNVLRKLHSEPDTLKGRKKYEEVLLYQINFPLYFEELSVEAKFLENYGYDIPNFIRNVILQERTFYQYRSKLKNILEDLKHSVAELEDEELSVMAVPTSDLINLLEPGINICWESTEILEFLKNIERGVDVFRGVVSQVKKIITEINSRIKLLSTCDLLQFESVLDKIPTCENYFNTAQKNMDIKVGKMVQIYSSFESLLKTLEMITCKTTTGKSEYLTEYYSVCEKKILLALVQFMLDNLEYLEEEILEHFIFPYITAAYQSEDELIRSSFIGIKLVFVIFFQSLTESTRKLFRWFDGSCISTSPFYSERFKQKLEFSYYLDLSIHPGIKKISLRILQKVFCFVDNIESM